MSVTTREVIERSPTRVAGRGAALALTLLGVGGLGLGFGGSAGTGWAALLVATALAAGLGVFGVVLSAIFEMTGARWGRAYRRIAEGSVVLMPLGLLGALALVLGAGQYMPWVHAHHLSGGKAIWLTWPFWGARVIGSLLVADGLCLTFLYYSLRRDFCIDGVRDRLKGRVAAIVCRGIVDGADLEAEARRCSRRMATLAPVVGIVFALTFTLLGFDLIMALEPEWFSTLFGAWFFVGHLFAGVALLALVSVVLRKRLGLQALLTETRQGDLATLLFAFCLVHTDFFWSQYLTIWYGNLPEETGYVIERTVDASLPWASVSWVTLAAIFILPFVALLFRRVKQHGLLLGVVAGIVVVGVFLARFLEIAPALVHLSLPSGAGALGRPLAAAGLVTLGLGGPGWWLYGWLLTQVPIMPVGDPVFRGMLDPEGQG